MKPPRDINKIIKFLLTDVVPPDQAEVRDALRDVYKSAYYKPPEMQRQCWFDLGEALHRTIGNPDGIPWAERIASIMADKEQIPEGYKELDPADLDPSLFQ